MAKKRTTLPKDFEELLKKGNLEELIKVFDSCAIDARGSFSKQTAFAYSECPHELAKWLIEQGADIEALDLYGHTPLNNRIGDHSGNIKSLIELGADVNKNNGKETPLHCAVARHHVENVKILLESGSHVDSVILEDGESNPGYTPLEYVLFTCSNTDIEDTVKICRLLLDRGAKKTERMKNFVRKIGESFEFYRENFNTESEEWKSNGLDALYKIFDVTPVPQRVVYDGVSPIVVKEQTWQKQHQELWKLLVPGSGSAQTMQGEVIRISGRLARELKDNGGINWDKEFKRMAESFLEFVQEGESLSAEEISELTEIIREVKQRKDNSINRLAELGVQWVLKNTTPIDLQQVKYKR